MASMIAERAGAAVAAGELTLRVARRAYVARDVVSLELARPDGAELPSWQPGAHVDLALPCADHGSCVSRRSYSRRSYSLCGDPADRRRWRLAVLRVPDGRGGSAFVHERLTDGATVQVTGPYNRFPFGLSRRCLFIGGGIGITPILPMVHLAHRRGLPWRLVYAVSTRDRLAFADELRCYGERVQVHVDAESGLLDLPALMAGVTAATDVYACGPAGMLDTLQSLATASPPWHLHLERFTADAGGPGDVPFDVVVASTGSRFTVPVGRSILEVLERAGVGVDFSCREGTCGTCETTVLSGEPDHRDAVLTPDERAAGDSMMLCVSRARRSPLVLDL